MRQLELGSGLLELVDPEQENAEMEAHGLRMREDADERAEPAERQRGIRLVEEPDGRRDAGVGIVRRLTGGGGELPLRRARVIEALQSDAVEDLLVGSAA